jgi:hypothetical protein
MRKLWRAWGVKKRLSALLKLRFEVRRKMVNLLPDRLFIFVESAHAYPPNTYEPSSSPKLFRQLVSGKRKIRFKNQMPFKGKKILGKAEFALGPIFGIAYFGAYGNVICLPGVLG